MTSLTYALSWSMGSGSPVSFHAFNVALHGANTALVTILLTTLGAAPLLALLGGAVFAVHPVHVEAVANSVGRADALMALFVLLGALAYLRRFRFEWARVGLVSLAYVMALASKENGVVFPALLIVLSLLFPERAGRGARAQLPVFVALAGVLAMYLGVRYQVLGTLLHQDAAAYIMILPPWLRVSTAVANITDVTRLLLFPADLVVNYGPEVILPAGIGALRFWVGAAVLLAAGALAVSSLRRSPWTTLGIVWVVLSLSVVGNVLYSRSPSGWRNVHSIFRRSAYPCSRWASGSMPSGSYANLPLDCDGVRSGQRRSSWFSAVHEPGREHPLGTTRKPCSRRSPRSTPSPFELIGGWACG